MKLSDVLRRLKAFVRRFPDPERITEPQQLMLGRLLAAQVKTRKSVASLAEVEFKVFSQWGDDGIIQWLTGKLDIPHKTFIEFGVENYREANTRFLLMNDNWSGLVMDGSSGNVAHIKAADYYWRHELTAKCAFIDAANINSLIASEGFVGEIGILHIDLDGNDYWVWKAIDVVSPAVVILEYNAVFGAVRTITVPYDPTFQRTQAHFSNLYFGASLAALHQLSKARGYVFIGCNSAGNNAFFVRRDKLVDGVRELTLQEGFVESKARESRDVRGNLTFLSGPARLRALSGLPVFDTSAETMTTL